VTEPQRAAGLGFVALSALCFGAMAIFARLSYAAGADVPGVLLTRFTVAGGLLLAYMLATRRAWPRGRTLGVTIGMGSVLYVGQAACFFAALHYASAGLVALLLYVYPTLVCLISALVLRQPLAGGTVALLALSFAGIALTLGGGEGSAAGVALGLGAAAFYAVYIVIGARELPGTDAVASTTVVCLSAAATVTLAGLWRAPGLPTSSGGWAALAALSILSTLVAILAFFAGLKRVGPATASIVSTLEPVVTVALAAVFLHERLTATQLVGGALVVLAAAWIARRGTSAPID
jgi:drug/metabolite transporter (DMT)-like permease